MKLSADAQAVVDIFSDDIGISDHGMEALEEYLRHPLMSYTPVCDPAVAAELREFVRRAKEKP